MADNNNVIVQVPTVSDDNVKGAFVPTRDTKKVIISDEKDNTPKTKMESKDIPFFILLIVLACLFITPILLVLMNSFKGKLYLSNAPFAFPNAESFVGLDNYTEGAGKIGFFRSTDYRLYINVCVVYCACQEMVLTAVVSALCILYDCSVPDGYVSDDTGFVYASSQ